ncbi:sulfite exporter TauE/SafE family protein [uncultured Sulfitobacter sp.]|uniref:sulfite exporter TauE/SafE family protein n=1 Tax=uncultured Sulfitobacter sp. TaxID=191468 RepID=UPI00262B5FBA|nr:sulfite exporter TauE/SafE family protein [uncultured Sulfitobacter sp.]
MDALFPLLSPSELIIAALIAVLAGFVKGVVGFAMPLVFVSGLTTFMSAELALAGLILPTLITNVQQALRQGVQAAVQSTVSFRVFLGVGCLALLASAQLVRVFPDQIMMAVIGVPVTFFASLQLAGYQISLPQRSRAVEVAAGAVAGGLGGISGIWGPPTVAYLTALNTPKQDQMRVQGVIYGLGAVALLVAHVMSGVLRAETIVFSVAMVPPAYLGVRMGLSVMDRIDQVVFRRATLFVLLVAGLNLMRRAVMG